MLKFSIITPNLNQGRFLESNLFSISNQSYPSIEHIVLDCNSNDESAKIVKNFDHKKTFVYIHDSDRGQSDAINKGFLFSTGEIITWLNADDQYTTKNTLTEVAAIFESNLNIDVVYGRGEYINAETGEVRSAWIQTEASNLLSTLSHSVGIIQPSLFFRKSLLNRIGILDISNNYSMDYDFWIRMVKSNATFHFLDSSLSKALLHNNSKSVKTRSVQLRETIDVCVKHYGFAHPRWITAYAKSVTLGDTSFLNAGTDTISEIQKEEIDSIERTLFRTYNASLTAANRFIQTDPENAKSYLNIFFPEYNKLANANTSHSTLSTSHSCDISFYPEFHSLEALSDQLQRIRWYLPSNSALIVRLFVSEKVRLTLQDKQRLPSIPTNVSIAQSPDSAKEFLRLLKSSRAIGVWQNFGKNSPIVSGNEGLRVFNIDKHHESRREAFQYSVLLHELDWQSRHELKKQSELKLLELLEGKNILKNAYLFCTGPSISEAYKFDFSNGYRIICNSIVNNDELMEMIQPQFIVAADPVFHFGSSEYSYAFRDKLRLAAEKYGATILVPFFFYPLIEKNCPELLPRTIGIPQDPNKDFNFDLRTNGTVRGSDNILTILMIPLGATIASNLYVLGCDGRKPDEDYFWKHDKSSQFNTLMDNARNHHPAFFNHCDYSNYYENHCSNLEKIVTSLEVQDKSLHTLTTSYIPCLAARSASQNS
jgi:glycosyltransferase involved in cell wall biosynthesis